MKVIKYQFRTNDVNSYSGVGMQKGTLYLDVYIPDNFTITEATK